MRQLQDVLQLTLLPAPSGQQSSLASQPLVLQVSHWLVSQPGHGLASQQVGAPPSQVFGLPLELVEEEDEDEDDELDVLPESLPASTPLEPEEDDEVLDASGVTEASASAKTTSGTEPHAATTPTPAIVRKTRPCRSQPILFNVRVLPGGCQRFGARLW